MVPMRPRRLLAPVSLGLLVLAFLALFSVAGAATSVTVQLSAQNNSGETGTAELTDMGGGQTKVVITLTGAPSGVAQPAHIHEGTCANLNPTPKYPLTSVQGGKSETTVNVSLTDLMAKPFAINVHKSAQEIPVYVACGNIPTQAAGGTTPSSPPATGAGGMAGQPFLPWIAGLGLLAIVVLGGAYAVRRRA